jgi:hypothetical protein
MKKTTGKPADTDVIGKALAARRPRRPQRMAREPAALAAPAEPVAAPPPSPERPTAPVPVRPGETKIAGVIALLKRRQGATIEELMEATGWLPHSTRAALTGLRKKGHVLAKDKRGDATCYRIAKAGK